MTNSKQKLNSLFLKAILVALFCFAFSFVGISFNVNAGTSKDNLTEQNTPNYTWQYEQFLSLSEEEQASYGVLPRMYEVSSDALYLSKSYNALLNSTQTLPEEYTLFSVNTMLNNFLASNRTNTDNLPKNIGNQRSTNICWSYAALTAFETSLYKMGVVATQTSLNFSELDLAYTVQVANRGESKISGGTFDLAYEYLSSGQGPVNEKSTEANTSELYWSSDAYATSYYANKFYGNTEHSGYSALEACYYPSKSSLDTTGQDDLRNSIKNHIKNYGAVTASIYMDSSYLYNSIYYNYTGSHAANHAIALVGWDDNISYTLSDGTVYTGAYIAQNSYGTGYGDNGYFYVMYSDTNIEENVAGFVRVDNALQNSLTYNNLEGTTYENQFITMGSGYTYYLTASVNQKTCFVNFYQTKDVADQYISRIKVPTVIDGDGAQSKFYVYVLNNLTQSQVSSDNNIKDTLNSYYSKKTKVKNINATTTDEYLFTAQQNTYYTVELGEQITLDSDYFAICVEYISGSVYFKDNVNDNDGLSSSQKTYTSTNYGSSWQYYKGTYSSDGGSVTGNCILPMYVETEYSLGTIEYSKQNVDEVYAAKEFSAQVTVINLDDYTILYSLDSETWSANNYAFKNASDTSYTVYFKIIADFYKTVEDSVTIKISKKDLVISPVVGQYKYYGDDDSTIDHSQNGNLKGESPKFSGKLEREPGNNVGEYLINLGSRKLVDNDSFLASNYNLVFDDSQDFFYQIKPRKLNVEVDLSGKVYGESDPEYFYITYSNAVETPSFDGNLKREEGENVGLYDVYVNTLILIDNASSGFVASNYQLVFDADTNADKFEILTRPLVILPESNIQKVYLQEDPEFTFTYSNNLYSQTPSFEGSLSREQGEDVGEYAYTIGSLTLKDNGSFLASNYNLVLSGEEVNFIINYGTLTGCEVDSREVFYDGTIYTLTPRSTVEDNVSITFSTDQTSWQSGSPQYKDVGLYTIYFKFEKANFNPIVLTATLNIKQYNLYLEPNLNQFKYYGDKDSTILFSFTNPHLLVNELPGYTGGLYRVAGEDVGEYLIDTCTVQLVDNGNFKASNYNLIFDNLNNICYQILPRELTLTPDVNQSKTYGKDDPTLTYEISNLAFDEIASTQGSLQRASGETVGYYQINLGNVELVDLGNFKKDNYTLKLTDIAVDFEIKAANIIVQVNDKTSYYGDNVITTFDSTISGDYIEGDELNINYFCEVDRGSVKGDYPILASAENSNYNITVLSGTYHVLFKTFEVQFYALGSYVKSVYVEHFALINTHEIPQITQDGYSFLNWKIINDDTSYRVIDVYSYQVTSDVVLTASMELIEYTIYLHTNNENGDVLEKSYTILDDDTQLDFVKKAGHTFENWYDNSAFEGEPVAKVESGSFGNKHFYAKWLVNNYIISLPEENSAYQIDCLGNSLTQLYNSYFDFKVNLGDAYSQSANKIKVYAVSNNGTQKDLLEINSLGVYSIENVINNYQIVVENVQINTYTIEFVIDDIVSKTITKSHGETLEISEYPQIPTKQNYDDIPAYWNVDNGILSVNEDKTITAIYTPDIYDVVIVVNDQIINKQVVYGEDISEDELRKELNLNMFEYFVFDKPLTNIDCDSVINAKVESNIYIVYISVAALAGLIILIAVIFAIRKHKNNKFKWWEYAKHSDDADTNQKGKNK